MRKNIYLILILLIFSFHCSSQSADNKKNLKLKTGNPFLKWERFENHPAHSILDTVPIFNVDENVVFKPEAYEKYFIKDGKTYENDPIIYLIKNCFIKYYSQYSNAKNEFEKKRLEKRIFAERDSIKNSILEKKQFKVGMLMRCSEYSFDKKGFFLTKSPDAKYDLKTFLSSIDVVINPDWIPKVDFISVSENDAEKFIKDNQKREVLVEAIIEISGWSEIKKSLEFLVVSTVDDDPRVLDIYPKISDIEKSFNILAENKLNGLEISELKPELFEAFKYGSSEALDRYFLQFENIYNKCLKYGFDKLFTPEINQILKQDKLRKARAESILEQFLTVGKKFTGYQLSTTATKKSIIIEFNEKDSEIYDQPCYMGTCHYSNGRKSIVIARILHNNYKSYYPFISICFYREDDDEIGFGGGCFYLIENQLLGYDINEKLDYGTHSKTVINLK